MRLGSGARWPLGHVPVGRQDEGRRCHLQEEPDRLEDVDHRVVEAPIEIIDEDDDRLDVRQTVEEFLELLAEFSLLIQ